MQQIKTAHYTFNVLIKNNFSGNIHYSQYLEVGDHAKPCLSLRINTAESEQIFDSSIIKTAKLSNIEALYNCVLEDDAKERFETYSFGKELLLWVIDYIKINFTHVIYLQLDDESYIPCNRESEQTLDLLSYSIAINCKTWYEMNFNAILPSTEKYTIYKDEIKVYSSPEEKSKYNWKIFYLKNVTTPFAMNLIKADEDTYKNMYEESKTFPEFFRKLSDFIGKENRCVFFKNWLQEFIKSYINVEKRWIIPLHKNGGNRKRRGDYKTKRSKRTF
jgi:hypothetical protein